MNVTDETAAPPPVPASVRAAVWLVWGVIVLSGVSALLTVVLRDQLVRSWSVARPRT